MPETNPKKPSKKFWRARSSFGRRPKFSAPRDLWKACEEYFEYIDANPLWDDKIVSYQGEARHVPTRKMRAMTIGGLMLFLDMSRSKWKNLSETEGFDEVVQRAEEVIRTQKFQGAAAELLNANIISRELGLADKKEHTVEQTTTVEIDTRALARVIAGSFTPAQIEELKQLEQAIDVEAVEVTPASKEPAPVEVDLI